MQYLAQFKNPVLSDNYQNKTGANYISGIVVNIVTILFVVGVTYFFFIMVIGAIAWITSGGDKQTVEKARSRISTGLVGLLVLLSIYAVLQLLDVLFGVTFLNPPIPAPPNAAP